MPLMNSAHALDGFPPCVLAWTLQDALLEPTFLTRHLLGWGMRPIAPPGYYYTMEEEAAAAPAAAAAAAGPHLKVERRASATPLLMLTPPHSIDRCAAAATAAAAKRLKPFQLPWELPASYVAQLEPIASSAMSSNDESPIRP